MCEQKSQLYSGSEYCELQLYKNVSATNCTYLVLNTPEEWRKIRENEWLLSMMDEVQAEVRCEENEEIIYYYYF